MIQLNIKDEKEMGKSLHETYHKNLKGTLYFLFQDSHEIDLVDKNLIYYLYQIMRLEKLAG